MNNPVKIRLQGSPSEVEEITRTLRQWLRVLDESDSDDQLEAIGVIRRYLTVKRPDGTEDEGIPLIYSVGAQF